MYLRAVILNLSTFKWKYLYFDVLTILKLTHYQTKTCLRGDFNLIHVLEIGFIVQYYILCGHFKGVIQAYKNTEKYLYYMGGEFHMPI